MDYTPIKQYRILCRKFRHTALDFPTGIGVPATMLFCNFAGEIQILNGFRLC